MKVVAFAGGVGGAKLVHGLAALLSPNELSVIVNTGDDFEYWGLQISPDLDTVCYTLAGLANPQTGWGLQDETWQTLKAVSTLGGHDWFQLGDKDLATHLVRTNRLATGESLSAITRDLCLKWGVKHRVLPMSNDPVRTMVNTVEYGVLGFQEYFVQHKCEPRVKSFAFIGAAEATPVEGAIDLIAEADLVVFAPSNPWVSVDPILAVPGYRKVLQEKTVIGVSPIIGGKALKGPAAKMYRELGIEPSASAVANHYRGLLSGFVVDQQDKNELVKIQGWRIISVTTNIIMKDVHDRIRLAEETLEFGKMILRRSQ